MAEPLTDARLCEHAAATANGADVRAMANELLKARARIAELEVYRAACPDDAGEAFMRGYGGEPITFPCGLCGLQLPEGSGFGGPDGKVYHLACDHVRRGARIADLERERALLRAVVNTECYEHAARCCAGWCNACTGNNRATEQLGMFDAEHARKDTTNG